MVWRRDGISIALILCMIALSLIGSLGQLSEVDGKEVEKLWRSCGFNPREIREQLSSSNVTPKELDLALQNCLIDRHNPPIHIPVTRHTKYLPAPYSDHFIALRHQLVAKRKARASAHEIRQRAGPTARSPSPGPAPVPSPSDAATLPPSIPIPAPPPARVLPLPIKTISPPPKAVHHAQVVKNKKPQKEHSNNFLLIEAVMFSVLGTSLVAFILFCCYRCKKKRDFHAYSQRDDRPLLSLSLSDFSGSSRTSCSSPIDINKLGALKSDSGHHQNGFHHIELQHGHMSSLKLSNATANTVPLETVEIKMTELTPSKGPPSAAPPPLPPPLPQKTMPGHPPPPNGPRPPVGSRPGPPPPPASGGSGPPPPPPPGGNKPSGPPRPPGPLVPSKARPPPLKAAPGTASNGGGQKPKLKPFFWDKVSANTEQAVVWNQIKSGSFQFSEEMIENLFGYQANDKSKATGMKGAGQSDLQSPCVRLLESKKSQNLAISLKALNVKIEDVITAVNEGNELPAELIETLLKMWPTTQEENKLLLYSGDLALLGPAEQFLIELIKVHHVYDRLDYLYFMSSLQEELTTCREAFSTLEVACKELKDSRIFKKILEAVIKIGNFINKDTNRGGAVAIKLDNLLKLRDLKAKDGKTTLLHVVLQEIIRSEGKRMASQNPNPSGESDEDYYEALGLKVISGIGNELENVKKSSGLDMDVITSTVEHLGKKLEVIKRVLETKIKEIQGECGFRNVLEYFVNQSEEEVKFLSQEKKRVWDLVEDTAKSFYPSTKKDEGLRLFVVVRDFLWMWDKACKDVKEAAAEAARSTRPKRVGSLGEGSGSMVRDPRQHLIPAIKSQRVGVDDSSSDEES
ncbi:formin-like protein 11 isoform X1 [Carex littledalei]|uniref:Formin-like protein n=1 Tax=Carex littledalei TaxID=544730 RepID=A0A833QL74_9POAL|nr:formin-like protein 11 isoform X1 [Carex littledalei]